ncbi:MAG: tripartite tricarboxylate transporter permease [Pseudomonadota bacterium]
MADFLASVATPDLAVLMVAIIGGVLIGYAIGALPGFDITTGVAVLLPLSYMMEQGPALAFFTSMYCSGVFAGSITAILFGIPGTSESVMSAVEGYPFTKRGEPGFALGVALVCSGLGGAAAALVLMTLAPALAHVAIGFGPGDYAALGVMGCAAIVSASGGSISKNMLALMLGLFLSTIGADPVTGDFRFVVAPILEDGVGLIPAIIGLFAVSDVLWRVLVRDFPSPDRKALLQKWRFPTFSDYAKLTSTSVRSWCVGLFTGVLPGAGASSAAFIAHSVEANLARKKGNFSNGNANALAAPETAKNAAAVGALIPLLALGIPGSGTAAVILGAFEIHNLQVGPLLFTEHPALVKQIFISVLIANIVFMVAGSVLMRPISLMTAMPYPVIAAGVLTLGVAGSIATGGAAAAGVMLVLSLIGIGLRLAQFPMAPVVLGIVLGPIIEVYFRRALLMADGDVQGVFASATSIGLLGASVVFLSAPAITKVIAKRGDRGQAKGA